MGPQMCILAFNLANWRISQQWGSYQTEDMEVPINDNILDPNLLEEGILAEDKESTAADNNFETELEQLVLKVPGTDDILD